LESVLILKGKNMKKILIVTIVLLPAIFSYSTNFPVIEPFDSSKINNTWEQFWWVDATLESVQASGEYCGFSPQGDRYIGKSTCDTNMPSTSGHQTGEDTDTSYTLQAYIYTEVTNELDPDDILIEDYWYQMLIFYRTGPTGAGATAYGRFHTHLNSRACGSRPELDVF
jgi:hypothetical protein